MKKELDRRKSRSCPKYCDGKGCYETLEEKNLMETGKKKVWMIHCKELDKIHGKQAKNVTKIFNKLINS